MVEKRNKFLACVLPTEVGYTIQRTGPLLFRHLF